MTLKGIFSLAATSGTVLRFIKATVPSQAFTCTREPRGSAAIWSTLVGRSAGEALIDAGMRRYSVRDRRICGPLKALSHLLCPQSSLCLAPSLAAFLDLSLGAALAAGFTTGGNGVVADSLHNSFACW